jgi:hypothetical protein
MTDRLEAFHWLLLIMAITGGVIFVIWAMRSRQWWFAIAPLSWLLHVAVFYTALLIFPHWFANLPTTFNWWSSVVRLHSMFLLWGAGIALLITTERR